LVPGGSITKALTATLCLQLAEAGKLDLDAPMHEHVDKWLRETGLRETGVPWAPLSALWGVATINNVTTRQLLAMRSGLRDYDDRSILYWTLMQEAGRERDFEPLDFIFWGQRDKSFLWNPGAGGAYSGTGYVLLGLVLASVTNASTWDQLAQSAVFDRLPPSEKAWYSDKLMFMGRGPCSQYGPRVIPQYNLVVDGAPEEKPSAYDWIDALDSRSCLNGWTMGNILTSTAALARFYADLHAPGKLISASSLKMMLTGQPLTIGGDPPKGTPYGLGQMRFDLHFGGGNVTLWGHGGEDWGSGFPSANWVVELNMSMIIGINMGEKATGMNTSLTRAQNSKLIPAAFCRILNALSVYRGKPSVDCSKA